MTIKVSELFLSIQGEALHTGVPSIFLRTFGCNFTCSGFGMPEGQISDERFKINAEDHKEYKSIPLVNSGCDSFASWDPRFKHFSSIYSTDDIAGLIGALLPHGYWKGEHLVITGGEPLLGWQREYPELLRHPTMQGLRNITFETNGTQHLTDDFFKYLEDWQEWDLEKGYDSITFSVSPKLSCSGEPREKAIIPSVVCQMQDLGHTYLKFVVATEKDVNEALEVIEIYRTAGFKGQVYLMPIGGVESVYSLNNRRVAELAIKHSLRYSDRLQVPLFKNAHGT